MAGFMLLPPLIPLSQSLFLDLRQQHSSSDEKPYPKWQFGGGVHDPVACHPLDVEAHMVLCQAADSISSLNQFINLSRAQRSPKVLYIFARSIWPCSLGVSL